jgi:hypothetical protein
MEAGMEVGRIRDRGWVAAVMQSEDAKVDADKANDASVEVPMKLEAPLLNVEDISQQLDTLRSDMRLELETRLATVRSDIQDSMWCNMQEEVSRQVAVAMKAMGEQYEEKAKMERQQHEERFKEEQKRHEESTKEERQRGKWEQERLRDEIKRLESRVDSIMLATSQNQVEN